ncbi:low temperature requirement protein A [Demequina aurantiaca]|uniref:low temperature requirement protein A n=1 Tax=Demequina aurantiaca TaxID=676200 RepID=UPI000AA11890|nr:low temperature requirement protein A [Demequina aurantiaca]
MADPTAARFRLTRMVPRSADEEHRAATPLELFFDLVFVIAVSIAASNLHHALSEGHPASGLYSYLFVFFGIWWGWMNFTWFATSFGTDDWFYRVLTFVQMGGVLVYAAGIGRAFNDHDYRLLVAGYVLMRIGMVAQWLRASRNAGELRRTTQIYAFGIATTQVLWLGWLLIPESPLSTVVLLLLIAAELAVPILAERETSTPWHPHHITERFGLFTIIVLGESLLASANAIIEALQGDGDLASLISLSVLTLVVTASLWWIYFWPPHHREIGSFSRSVRYGYGHYIILAAAAAVSVGVEVEIDALTDEAHIGEMAASLTIAIPVAVFMLTVWWVTVREHADRTVNIAIPAGAALVLADPIIPIPIAITSIVLVALVVILVRHPPLKKDQERGHITGDDSDEPSLATGS